MLNTSSVYDKNWINTLLAHTLRDPGVARIVIPRMDIDDFQLPVHQCTWRAFTSYFSRFNKVPQPNILIAELCKLTAEGYVSDTVIPAIAQLITQLYSVQLDSTWFLDEFATYIQTLRIGSIVTKGHQYIENKEFNKFIFDVRGALASSSIEQSPTVSPFASFIAADDVDRVPTMIADVDAAIGGGLGEGEVGMVMALTGAGKTIMLENFFYGAAINKRNVLYCTWEMGHGQLSRRLYSCATGIPYNDIKRASPELRARVIQMTQRFEPYTRIKEFLTGPASLQDVENDACKLADEGWPPQLIITDWLDLITSIRYGMETSSRVDTRHILQAVAEEHVFLAKRLKVPVWTATQANRVAEGKQIIDLRHQAEAFNKSWKLDVVLTMQPDATTQGVYNCYTAKNRDNPKKFFKLKGDLARMRFKPLKG